MTTAAGGSAEEQATPVEQDTRPPTNTAEPSNERVHSEQNPASLERIPEAIAASSTELDRMPLPLRLAGSSIVNTSGQSPITEDNGSAAALETEVTPNSQASTEAQEAALEILTQVEDRLLETLEVVLQHEPKVHITMPKEPVLPKEIYQESQPTESRLDEALKFEVRLAAVGRYLEDLGTYHRQKVQASIALDELRDVKHLVADDILKQMMEVQNDERMLRKMKMVKQISEYKFRLWSESEMSEVKDFKVLADYTAEFCKSQLKKLSIKLPSSEVKAELSKSEDTGAGLFVLQASGKHHGTSS